MASARWQVDGQPTSLVLWFIVLSIRNLPPNSPSAPQWWTNDTQQQMFGFKHDINEWAELLTSHFLSVDDTIAAPVGHRTRYCICLQKFFIKSFIRAGKWDEHQKSSRPLQWHEDTVYKNALIKHSARVTLIKWQKRSDVLKQLCERRPGQTTPREKWGSVEGPSDYLWFEMGAWQPEWGPSGRGGGELWSRGTDWEERRKQLWYVLLFPHRRDKMSIPQHPPQLRRFFKWPQNYHCYH